MKSSQTSSETSFTRRNFLRASAAAGVGALIAPTARSAERDWSGNQLVRYPDVDVIVLDERFKKYKIGNTPIQRLYVGTLWGEGPAWSGVGRYLVWSDIP